jgi:hypothetical protein
MGLGVGQGVEAHRKKPASYGMLHSASDLAGSCEHGNEPSGFTNLKQNKALHVVTRTAMRLGTQLFSGKQLTSSKVTLFCGKSEGKTVPLFKQVLSHEDVSCAKPDTTP